MTTEIHRCFRVLELGPSATLEQVKQAYRELVKVWHPDRFTNDAKLQRKAQERLKEINIAYETLEQFLASGAPPPRGRPTSSQAADDTGKQNRRRDESERQQGNTTHPPGPPPQPSKPKESPAGIVWIILGLAVLVVAILESSFGNSNRSVRSDSGSIGNQSSRVDVEFLSQVFSQALSQYDTRNNSTPPVSKALDEKNGFKDFKFGLTLNEARETLSPSSVTDQLRANVTTFHYQATPANRIGDFSTDIVSLRFFDGRLHRIDVRFSNFQNEIFEAFKVNYGEPLDDNGWTLDDKGIRAKSWRGEKVSAAILSYRSPTWDSLVIYNTQANRNAQEYAAKEPERAAKDFGPAGFKSLVMGMTLQEINTEVEIIEEDRLAAVKKVAFKKDKKDQWQSVGFYPLEFLTAEFFKERLYRINLGFEENRKEMFDTFKQRFGHLQENDTWTRGPTKLKGKSSDNGKLYATILAPSTSSADQRNWDVIVLLDVGLWHEAEKFKLDAPKRAAKEF